MPITHANRYVQYDFKDRIVISDSNYIETNNPVTNVNAIGFICADATCSTVSGTLWNGQTFNSGSNDYIIFDFPTADINVDTYGYGLYIYKDGYIAWEQNPKWWGIDIDTPENPAGPYTKYLSQKELCIAPIDNFVVLNDAQENIPLVINVGASLDATTRSALEAAGPLNYVPPTILDQYSVETTITMTVYNSSDDVVYTDSSIELIPYSESKNVEFTWTPTVNGTYKIEATSTATDDKCLSSDTQTATKNNILVYPAAPRDECYTILNGLSATGYPHHEVSEEITVSYDKISNYANDEIMGTPAYVLTPIETSMSYTIKNDTGTTIYTQNPLIAANPTNNGVAYNFAWTPTTPGNYTISISGVAQDASCTG
ncbi:MAG: hypothetical protein KAS12_07415, partial [Candidatus Aenigmarchaeota archaeon]|nr:hypothetical protein [Candidatus Aenigmarchaeota archaeon]